VDGGVKARWAVRCPGYTTPAVASKEAAERLCAQIEDAGHCMFDHSVVELPEVSTLPGRGNVDDLAMA
jgi:hypothetical protein